MGANAVSNNSEQLATPLTRGLMEAAHVRTTPTFWAQPADMQKLPAFVFSYMGIQSPAADLYPSWYKQ